MASPIATGVVQIVPSFKGLKRTTEGALAGVDRQFESTGRRSGNLLTRGFKSLAITGVVGAGAALATGFGVAMAKGFGRLTAIENAQKKLEGLGHDAKTVEQIMNNALNSVKGTAFGLDEAASVSAALVASGIKPGQQLEKTLKTVADSATIAGIGMDEMGAIFGKVAATGRLQGDELNQLSERGIPALQLLSEHLGVTTDDVRKMVSKGKVDFATFAAAMEAGMGGAALKSGETFTGAWKNVQAALGRLGATLLQPIFDALKVGMNQAMPLIDAFAAAMEPLAVAFGRLLAAAMPVISGVFEALARALIATVTWVGQNLGLLRTLATIVGVVAAAYVLWNAGLVLHNALSWAAYLWASRTVIIGAARIAITTAMAAAQWKLNAALAANPIGIVLIALAALVAGFVLAYKRVGWFRDMVNAAWAGIKTAIGAVVDWLNTYVVGVFKQIFGILFKGDFAGGTLAEDSPVVAFFFRLREAAVAVVSWFQSTLVPALTRAWQAIAAGAVWLWQNAILPAWNGIRTAVAVVVAWFQTYVAPVLRIAVQVLGAVFSWLYRNIIIPVFAGIQLYIRVWWTVVQAIFSAVLWFVRNVLAPVFNFLWQAVKIAFQGIRAIVQVWWNVIVKPLFTAAVWFVRNVLAPVFNFLWQAVNIAFQAIRSVIQIWWNVVVRPIFNAVVWFVRNVLAPAFTWFWRNVIVPVWNGIRAAISMAWTWIRANVFEPINRFIRTVLVPAFVWLRDRAVDSWNQLRANIDRVWVWIRTKVFAPLERAVRDTLPKAFEKGKDAIGRAWDKLQDVAKKPVRFVVDTIINKGIIGGFNRIASKFGADEIDTFKLPKGFDSGGWTGPGPRLLPAGVVHADEFVVQKSARRRFERDNPGVLDFINRTGELPMLGAYAGGGMVWNNLWGIVKNQFPGVRLHSAYRPGATTASGNRSYHSRGMAIDITPSMQIFNWLRDNFGQSSELIFSPANGRQIKNGRNHYYTGKVRGMHFNHIHWANRARFGGPTAGASGDVEGDGFDILGTLLKPFQDLTNKVKSGVSGAGTFGDVVGAGAKKMIDMPIQWIRDNIGKVADFVSETWNGVKESVAAGTAKAQGRAWALANGIPLNGARWRAIDYIISRESGWDPKAKNPRSSAAGLPQFIKANQKHYGVWPIVNQSVWKQLDAFMKYVTDRFKGVVPAMEYWKRNRHYSEGGHVKPMKFDSGGYLPPGITTVVNATRKPEPVFTSEQWASFGAAPTGQRIGVNVETLQALDADDAIRKLYQKDHEVRAHYGQGVLV